MEQSELKSKVYRLTRLDHKRFFYHKCMLLDYLAASPPFSDYGMKSMLQSVTAQMTAGTYLVAISEERICGYLGWLLTTQQIAEDWVNGSGPLISRKENVSAAAPTILAVSDPDLLLPMVREMKRRVGNLPIFWKRHVKGRGLHSRQLIRP